MNQHLKLELIKESGRIILTTSDVSSPGLGSIHVPEKPGSFTVTYQRHTSERRVHSSCSQALFPGEHISASHHVLGFPLL